MSKGKHGEPWGFWAEGIDAYIVDGDGRTLLGGEKDEGAIYEGDPNAQRAVACVNAMDGIEDPAGVIAERDDLRNRLVALQRYAGETMDAVDDLILVERERDELREMVRELAERVEYFHLVAAGYGECEANPDDGPCEWHLERAALAKARKLLGEGS